METVETDILVVGSGGGALTAAVTAARLGADVIVAEKAPLFGGTSATSGGAIWIPNNHHQEKVGAKDSPEEAWAYLKALVGDDVPDAKLHAYIDNAPKMLVDMESNTFVQYRPIDYADYHTDLPGAKDGHRTLEPLPIDARTLGERNYDLLRPIHPVAQFMGKINWTMLESKPLLTRKPGWIGMMARTIFRYYLDLPRRLRGRKDGRMTLGNALLARLKLSADKVGVKLWLEAPLQELERDASGRITSAIIKRDGKRMRVVAKRGIILGAGGFERNAQMRAEHLHLPSPGEDSGSNPLNTGDAIRAGIAIGAATDLMDAAWWAPAYRFEGDDRSYPMFVERALPGSIIVNGAGKRYMNEAASYHSNGSTMIKLAAQGEPTIPSWFIFDAKFRSRYPLGPLLPFGPGADKGLPGKITKVLRKSDTISGLARSIGSDPAVLEATVTTFNGYTRTGIDLDFHRGEATYDQYYGDDAFGPNTCLGPIDKPPYYAVPIHPGDIGTKGGLVTDVNGQVLGDDGKPLPGLYAIGNTSASVMGRTYPGAGATIGPAMTFGWLAARHAMGAND
ncbi:MAG: fumarate reductase/succinate dehydrogenase flavoprotein [Bradyrhizobium sp.]|nr:fumarate reductase/succinate dehydrogenase flavoprotein [Bradyrhizobium sp.]